MGHRIETVFNWISRLAGLVVLLVGLAVLGVVVISATGGLFRPERPQAQLEQVAGTELGTELRLGTFQEVDGSAYLYAPLDTTRSGKLAVSSAYRGAGETRNVLFFDTASKKGHWLCAGNEQTILSQSFLTDPPSGIGPARKTIAILFEIEQTSADGAAHRRRLAIASPDGRQLTTITDQFDGVLGHHQLADQTVLIFYVAGGVAKVIDYDIAGRATRSNEKLSAAE